jgi:hypothetical protein
MFQKQLGEDFECSWYKIMTNFWDDENVSLIWSLHVTCVSKYYIHTVPYEYVSIKKKQKTLGFNQFHAALKWVIYTGGLNCTPLTKNFIYEQWFGESWGWTPLVLRRLSPSKISSFHCGLFKALSVTKKTRVSMGKLLSCIHLSLLINKRRKMRTHVLWGFSFHVGSGQWKVLCAMSGA